ncbi:3'-5' exonuclease [Chryseolinea sp. H1M3-3]|uniref:3'-5' exonuclease n=1 Tax=Chryseolinea sp. H1M3-3 TaxID=3034144 RepID=UPI0023EB2F3B|nr:3'-5' exonuclease [Chryseolinea sp. H1M3-3]
MEFRIADTFTDSLARLTTDEQKAVKITVFDLQLNPANPGMSFHKLDKAKDKNFWSVRVNRDIRIIVHKSESSLLICYVDHHDKAYDWAERRKLEVHPKTGAAQLVEIRETVKEVFVPVYVQEEIKTSAVKQKLFTDFTDEALLTYGVPTEWLNDVRDVNEDTLLELVDHLPYEAGEALLELATGGMPQVVKPVEKGEDPFTHPDALRRFRVMSNLEELERALEFPWDKWAIFLHPDQRQLIGKNFSGPARVSGSAGTGKTVVALHRAVFLARANPDARVLLTTFSEILANSLKVKLRRLVVNELPLAERIEIFPIDQIGVRLYKANIGTPKIVTRKQILALLSKASSEVEANKFSRTFFLSEWEQVVDAWQLTTWENYRDVKRLGRKTRLPEQQRQILWTIFSKVIQQLKKDGLITYAGIFNELADFFSQSQKSPFDFAVIDESQDITVYHLRFLAALGRNNPNALFFAGDLGQRIFQQPFSWKSLGVDVRGRSTTLKVNYRTSHQIRMQSDRLLSPEVTDADGNIEKRSNTVSVFNGPPPIIKTFSTSAEEIEFVSDWVLKLRQEEVFAHEIGVFVRSSNQLNRAIDAIGKTGVPYKVLDESVEAISGQIPICTMHLAKGLEFKAVVVMACDDEVIPLQERIETVADDADLEEVYNTERHLLYVACTRARDQLLLTSVEPSSEFLDDLKQ